VSRQADHPIDPLFTNRWSPRSFTAEPVPDAMLQSAFEAARWAPSALNAQPWRFVIARSGDAAWDDFTSLLFERNALWAAKASALVVILSARKLDYRGQIADNVSHSFDAGAAWANFAHQALLLGWHTHGIGGFDRNAARAKLAIPEDYAVEAMVALGRKGGLDTLPEQFHMQESPNARRPLGETVYAGRFGAPAFLKTKDPA
jgi:nitroreductase